MCNKKTKFFSLQNQQSAFIFALVKYTGSSLFFSILLKQTFSAAHANFQSIIETAFNCFTKNQLKCINDRNAGKFL